MTPMGSLSAREHRAILHKIIRDMDDAAKAQLDQTAAAVESTMRRNGVEIHTERERDLALAVATLAGVIRNREGVDPIVAEAAMLRWIVGVTPPT